MAKSVYKDLGRRKFEEQKENQTLKQDNRLIAKDKLNELKELFDNDLISKDEYEFKRKQISDL